MLAEGWLQGSKYIYIYIVNAQTFSDLVGTAGKLHHDMGIAAWFQMNEDTYTN